MLFRPWQPAFRLSCKHAQLNTRLVRVSSLPLFITVSILISCSSSFPKILFLIYLFLCAFVRLLVYFSYRNSSPFIAPLVRFYNYLPPLKKHWHSFPSITIPISLSLPHSYPSHHPSIPLLTTTIVPPSTPQSYPLTTQKQHPPAPTHSHVLSHPLQSHARPPLPQITRRSSPAGGGMDVPGRRESS